MNTRKTCGKGRITVGCDYEFVRQVDVRDSHMCAPARREEFRVFDTSCPSPMQHPSWMNGPLGAFLGQVINSQSDSAFRSAKITQGWVCGPTSANA